MKSYGMPGTTGNGSYGPFPVLILSLLLVLPCYGVIETYEFETSEQEQRYQHFTEVLRCPKCQNQNLAGSDSPIAGDLRRELAKQIREGKADQEIVDFMVARFGDFVLYDPPFQSNTLLLWLIPAGLFLAALLIVALLLRRHIGNRKKTTEPVLESRATDESFLSDGKAILIFMLAGVLVLAASWYFYQRLGAKESLDISRLVNTFYEEAAKASRENRQADPAQVRELIARLQKASANSKRDKQQGIDENDLQLLYLQGSLHAYLSEFEQAIPFYKDYLLTMPTDEKVLTEYVQILYLAADRQLSERVQFVVERALALNPHNQEVLALLAIHHFEHKEFNQAIKYWEQILATMPSSDPGYQSIQKAINTAKTASAKNNRF